MDLDLHVVDCVRRFNLKSDCLAREGLDKDLHATVEMEDKVEGGLLNIVCWQKLKAAGREGCLLCLGS